MRQLLSIFILFVAAQCFAQGSCPSGLPTGLTGNHCYFVSAQSGAADSNNGTSESTPWLHAPGMPNCSSTCAGVTPAAGEGFVFRIGDTWHLGITSGASCSAGTGSCTGGPWAWQWSGTTSTCVYEGTQTGCIYVGAGDPTWTVGLGNRAILNDDNPTNTSIVASCTYQTGTSANPTTTNDTIVIGNNIVNVFFDGFELTGKCGNTGVTAGISNTYITGTNTGVGGNGMNFLNNIYVHGWTTTSLVNTNSTVCNILGGGGNGLFSIIKLVIDGSDSAAGDCTWGQFPSWYHFKDSIVRYATDGVGQWCHDIHDNIFEHIVPVPTGGHTNVLECNVDASGNAPNQPANTPNVFYNNILRHSNSNVMWWFCPTTIPEYWFNNLIYDTQGEGWSVAGQPSYPCVLQGSGSGPAVYMFNNTLVDGALSSPAWTQPCYINTLTVGGGFLTIANEHQINTALDSGSHPCTGVSSATNISMSDSTANSQGYTSGSAGTYLSNTCANESTTPCAPTSGGNATVGTGTNETVAYCNALSAYSSESAISVDAHAACKLGTTDACAYNATSHSMSCPAQTAVARPGTGVWDSGNYEFSASGQASPPSCSPGSGNYASTQTVTCINPNSGTTVMCYTTNGSTPATNGAGTGCTTGTQYTTTISVSTAETLNVIAGTGTLTDSSVASYAYTFNVALPLFSPGGGSYSTSQTVTITSQAGATICYTTDGSTPLAATPGTCSHGTSLANGGSITVGGSETVNAIGTEASFTNSAVGSAAYVIGGMVYKTGNCSISAVATESAGNSYSWSCSPFATGDAVIFFAQCHPTSGTISAIGLASSGWTFTQLVAPQTTGFNSWGALFGAIAPNTSSATFTATFTGASDCANFATYIGGEFSGNNTTGGSVTFPVTGGVGGASGGCTQSAANVTPTSNNNAVWFACLDTVTSISSPWFGGANDLSGDFAEYQILSGGAGIAQTPTYTGSGVYVVEGTAILPLVQSAVGPPTNFIQVTQAPKVELQWTASTTPAVDYSIWRSTGGPFTKIKQGIIGTQWTDTNVERGVDYFYESQAYLPPPCKKKCDSAFSGQLQITCCQ